MGDDPADAFAEKNYWRFGLRVQLKKSEKSSVERIRAGDANLRRAYALEAARRGTAAPGAPAPRPAPVTTIPVF
jgi:hypothetical protein